MGFLKTLVNAAVGAAVPLEISGKALLKQTCKGYGVDIGRKPENAWNEMVADSMALGKLMVELSGSFESMGDKKSLHTNVVQDLEGKAVLISYALDLTTRSSLAEGPIRDLLVRHGVLKE